MRFHGCHLPRKKIPYPLAYSKTTIRSIRGRSVVDKKILARRLAKRGVVDEVCRILTRKKAQE